MYVYHKLKRTETAPFLKLGEIISINTFCLQLSINIASFRPDLLGFMLIFRGVLLQTA